MSDSWKMPLDEMHVSIRPEELDTILELRDTFDQLERLGECVSLYLEGGWAVKLVIPQLDIVLEVDVSQVWRQRLADLAVKGLYPCPMVYTGAASNLMVLEVQGKNAQKALAFGRDWRARCVIQAGEDREQHFYTWPQTLSLPSQANVEACGVQVYGEGGKLTLPPVLTPEGQDQLRWLNPPWETPPGPPGHRLLEFLKGHFSSAGVGVPPPAEDLPGWEEVFGHIASHAGLMQSLLQPGRDPEDYYRTLLAEARAAGLEDRRLLLGLLWHAPMGPARQEASGLEWLRSLLPEEGRAPGQGEEASTIRLQGQLAEMIQELSRSLASLKQERATLLKEAFRGFPGENQPAGGASSSRTRAPETTGPGLEADPVAPWQPGIPMEKPSLVFVPGALPARGEIPVNRKQYEAMIYELGRLAVLEKFHNRSVRETNSLRGQIEARRQEEIDHLRQLLREKKTRRWW